MSGTSARESYRAGKRSRPSDSQRSPMAPPVLFRLPSIAMPSEGTSASNVNAAMATSAALPNAASSSNSFMANQAYSAQASVQSMAPSSASSQPSPSAPAQMASATMLAEKSSGQRMLNMMIVVLLLAALAIIAWISLNRTTPSPSMAENNKGSDKALETLVDLKVPEVSTTTAVATNQGNPQSSSQTDEVQPGSASSLIDLPINSESSPSSLIENDAKSESLLSLDPSGIDASLASQPAGSSKSEPSNMDSTPTAQIQLRTPVPVGGISGTSLVDAQRSASQLTPMSLGSSTTSRVDTVSTPTQPTKVFPATTDPSRVNTSSSSVNSSTNTNSNTSGGSPSLWDGVQQTAPEGLQLSQNADKPSSTSGSTSSPLSISNPLSKEIPMGQGSSSATQVAQQDSSSSSDQGIWVGGGAPGAYTEKQSSVLKNSRPDLDPVMLARVKASGAANKSAVTNSPTQPINSYANINNAPAPNTNLYLNNASTSVASSAPINKYQSAAGNVPPGVTGNGTGTYLPPAGSAANQYAAFQYASSQNPAAPQSPGSQYPGAQYSSAPYPGAPSPNLQLGNTQYSAQLASGPNSAPTNMAGFNLPPRGATSGQPNNQLNSNYGQPGVAPQQPAAYQPQPAPYQQQGAYGSGSGSAYGNPAYAPPSGGMNMPGYQPSATYPQSKSPYPGVQPTTGMIGSSGYATVPTGDLIAPRPVMGQVGGATSVPYGSPQ